MKKTSFLLLFLMIASLMVIFYCTSSSSSSSDVTCSGTLADNESITLTDDDTGCSDDNFCLGTCFSDCDGI